jgi:hypothetical protein
MARQRRQQQGASYNQIVKSTVKESLGRKPINSIALLVGSSLSLAHKLILSSQLLGT